VFVLIGVPIALRFPRGGIGMVIAISLAIFGIYYVGLIGGETLGDEGYVPAAVAMWATNIIFGVLGLFGFMRWAESREPPAVRDGASCRAWLRLPRAASQHAGGGAVKILDRYIFRQFLGTFLLLVAALPFLFLITDLTDNLDRYLNGAFPFGRSVSYVYFIPQLIFWGFPVAALIATVFTIGSMTRHQEITAAKAGGVSFYRLTAPLILMAALLSIIAVGIGEVVPITNIKRAEVLGERARVTNPFRLNFVFRTEDGKTLAASRVNAAVPDHEPGDPGEPEPRWIGMRINQSASTATWGR
jgi:lipopolysaccharide export LptBFGC system permease protein LptF